MRARILATAVMATILWGAAGPASAGPAPGAPLISGVEQPVTYLQRFKITSPQARQIAKVAIFTSGSPGDDTTTGAQHATAHTSHRSPFGSPPWMPVALLLAFLATATGVKRLS